MHGLAEILFPQSIALGVSVRDWREAIRHAGWLLEKTGAADHAYTEAMVAQVEKHGPYIVVAPGFAFAHARPAEGVTRTALSWVRLAAPVDFGHSSNDPVSLVVGLASVDASGHTSAMAELARAVGSPRWRAELDRAETPEDLRAILSRATCRAGAGRPSRSPDGQAREAGPTAARATTHDHILTVCGNGLGTSLFLKNTLEEVLHRWGWDSYITVEATDTISAKGKAKTADLILSSGEIARTLGDPGIPIHVIEDFTSLGEVDAALRELYDI